jgi:hypothetical protein
MSQKHYRMFKTVVEYELFKPGLTLQSCERALWLLGDYVTARLYLLARYCDLKIMPTYRGIAMRIAIG